MFVAVVHAATRNHVEGHDPCSHWLLWTRKLHLLGVDIHGCRLITENKRDAEGFRDNNPPQKKHSRQEAIEESS